MWHRYTAGRQPKNPQNEPFLVWLSALANTTSPPLVISTSYGDDEPSVDYDYAQRVNTEFMKAGGRGISLLFSSGDSGVGGRGASCSAFVPTFPAGSPWVTAVGGTSLVSAASTNETVASFSSGGFANLFPSPDYQKDAVAAYLSTYGKNIPAQKYWNASGRAFPDISALGVDFPIVVGGEEVRAHLRNTHIASPARMSCGCMCCLLLTVCVCLWYLVPFVVLCGSLLWMARVVHLPLSLLLLFC